MRDVGGISSDERPGSVQAILYIVKGLAAQFTEFCRSISGAEDIEALTLSLEQKRSALKKADFFFANRTIICEIKTFETDTAEKFIRFLNEQGFDLPPGEYDTQQLFATRPDGEQLLQRASTIIATALSDQLADANRQIRDTMRLFGRETADGLVVVLNGVVEILGPPIVLSRLFARLAKTREDGSPYHDHIAHVLYFSEKHIITSASGDAAVAIPVANPLLVAKHDVAAFANQLVQAWAEFNGRWFEKRQLGIII